MFDKIKKLIESGKIEEAETELHSNNFEHNELFWILDATIKQKKQLWGKAINSYQKVLEINQKNNEALIQLEIIHNILNFWNPEVFNP